MSIKTISIIIKTISQGNQPLLTKPTSSKTSTSLLSRLNKDYLNFEVEKLISDSWASGTRKQYEIYFKQWTTLCKTRTVDISNASIKDGTELFLS